MFCRQNKWDRDVVMMKMDRFSYNSFMRRNICQLFMYQSNMCRKKLIDLIVSYVDQHVCNMDELEEYVDKLYYTQHISLVDLLDI